MGVPPAARCDARIVAGNRARTAIRRRATAAGSGPHRVRGGRRRVPARRPARRVDTAIDRGLRRIASLTTEQPFGGIARAPAAPVRPSRTVWSASSATLLLACVGIAPVAAQVAAPAKAEAPYVPTPTAIVDRMLTLAGVGPSDYVIDLGSGDGRLVITAVNRYQRARRPGLRDRFRAGQARQRQCRQGRRRRPRPVLRAGPVRRRRERSHRRHALPDARHARPRRGQAAQGAAGPARASSRTTIRCRPGRRSKS